MSIPTHANGIVMDYYHDGWRSTSRAVEHCSHLLSQGLGDISAGWHRFPTPPQPRMSSVSLDRGSHAPSVHGSSERPRPLAAWPRRLSYHPASPAAMLEPIATAGGAGPVDRYSPNLSEPGNFAEAGPSQVARAYSPRTPAGVRSGIEQGDFHGGDAAAEAYHGREAGNVDALAFLGGGDPGAAGEEYHHHDYHHYYHHYREEGVDENGGGEEGPGRDLVALRAPSEQDGSNDTHTLRAETETGEAEGPAGDSDGSDNASSSPSGRSAGTSRGGRLDEEQFRELLGVAREAAASNHERPVIVVLGDCRYDRSVAASCSPSSGSGAAPVLLVAGNMDFRAGRKRSRDGAPEESRGRKRLRPSSAD